MSESRACKRLDAAVMGAGGMSLRSKQAVTSSAFVPESARIRRRRGRSACSIPPHRSFATLASTCRVCSGCRAYWQVPAVGAPA